MHSPLFEEKPLTHKLRSLVFWLIIIAGLTLVVIVLVRGQQLVIRKPEAYQAVFLDNGQVYFGKFRSVSRDLWSLTDIYYLRAGTIQPASPAGGQAAPTGGQAGQEGTGQIDLIKLGAELHAPRDEMIINKEHVIFYEDLGEGGEVMKLIRKHKSGK